MPTTDKSRRNRRKTPYRIKRRYTRRHRKQRGGVLGDTSQTIRWVTQVKQLFAESADEGIKESLESYKVIMPDADLPFETPVIQDGDLREIGRTLRQVFQFGEEGMTSPDEFVDNLINQPMEFTNITLPYALSVEKGMRNMITGESETRDQILELLDDTVAGEKAVEFFTSKKNQPFYIWALMASVDKRDPTIPELMTKEAFEKAVEDAQIAAGILPPTAMMPEPVAPES
jgi:hypothetical protein